MLGNKERIMSEQGGESERRPVKPVKTWREKKEEDQQWRGTRRDFLTKTGKVGVGVGGLMLAAEVERRTSLLRKLGERLIGPLNSFLQRRQVVSEDEEVKGEAWWGKIYFVREGDTIDAIAQRVYPQFNRNQLSYRTILQEANFYNLGKTPVIYPGQPLYIPDPQKPAIGIRLGEKAMDVGFKEVKEVEGKKRFFLTIGGEATVFMKDGMGIDDQLVAPDKEGKLVRYRIAADLPAMPGYPVKETLVLEQVKPLQQ